MIGALTPLWKEELCPKKDSLLKSLIEVGMAALHPAQLLQRSLGIYWEFEKGERCHLFGGGVGGMLKAFISALLFLPDGAGRH